jgi:transposase
VEIAIEACGASHHWARLLQSFGHEVKLIAPQLVKLYVKRGKNDAADAEALCEAMSRPTMRFVPVKTAEQQADRCGKSALSSWAPCLDAVDDALCGGKDEP